MKNATLTHPNGDRAVYTRREGTSLMDCAIIAPDGRYLDFGILSEHLAMISLGHDMQRGFLPEPAAFLDSAAL